MNQQHPVLRRKRSSREEHPPMAKHQKPKAERRETQVACSQHAGRMTMATASNTARRTDIITVPCSVNTGCRLPMI